MPRKPKTPPVELPAIPAELLEQFGNGPMTAESINAATMALKKALIERALGGEMNHHLGYSSGAAKPAAVTNQRNGKGAKTVLTEDGPIRIEVPRDRDGSFEPLLIPKHERRFTGFDEKIVAMYARGMTIREIQGFLQEQYGTEFRPSSSARSPTRSWLKSRPGSHGRSNRCIRSCSSMLCASRSAKMLSYATRPSTSRWVSCPTEHGTFSACGSRTPRAPSSG